MGSVKVRRVWYDVVIAVVTVEPLAIGVRYSVTGFGDLAFLFAFAFAIANNANLDGGRDAGTPKVCTSLTGCSEDLLERGDRTSGVSSTLGGDGRKRVLGASCSMASSSRAV